MNTHPRSLARRTTGFSLIELLIVLTIIGVLTAILIPTATHVQKTMRMVEARRTAVELRTGIMNYYSEYKRYPAIQGSQTASGDVMVETSGSNGLIAALIATPDSSYTAQLNPRRILLFSCKTSRRPGMPGLSKEGEGYALFDPFFDPDNQDNYYRVVFDANYDNQIEVLDHTGQGTQMIPAGAAVWSYGPDHEPGSAKGKNDDVYAF